MKKRIYLSVLMTLVVSGSVMAATESTHQEQSVFNLILSIIEVPFLIIGVVFSFLTSAKLKGGKFGRGMKYLAWGFLVMAIGHIHMQMDHQMGFNLFNTLLGAVIGKTAWFLALIVTWGLSSYGFYSIYKASKL